MSCVYFDFDHSGLLICNYYGYDYNYYYYYLLLGSFYVGWVIGRASGL